MSTTWRTVWGISVSNAFYLTYRMDGHVLRCFLSTRLSVKLTVFEWNTALWRLLLWPLLICYLDLSQWIPHLRARQTEGYRGNCLKASNHFALSWVKSGRDIVWTNSFAFKNIHIKSFDTAQKPHTKSFRYSANMRSCNDDHSSKPAHNFSHPRDIDETPGTSITIVRMTSPSIIFDPIGSGDIVWWRKM